jgi:hypothetical protein
VTVQLIEVATGYHRWSHRFDRTLDDVFAIEDEIAESVATSLRGTAAVSASNYWLCPPKFSHDTLGCQFTNAPLGFSFHAQTCNV